MKKIKMFLEAVVVITVVLALVLPSSAVVTNKDINSNKNMPYKSYSTTLSAIHKVQPNPEPLTTGDDVLVSWDNPDEDDEKPKITANPDEVIVITYEAEIDVLTRVNPITYSDDNGESWNTQFLIDSTEYDGSGTTESPDIKYCPARDEFFFGTIDPLEAEYPVILSWVPGDIAGATEIPIWLYSWIDSEDYTEGALTYVGEWHVMFNIDTAHDITSAPALAYWLYVHEDEWAYHPTDIDPEWAHGGYYDGQSVLQTAPASKPEMATGQNRMYMVMETFDESAGYSKISYKATYTDLDPESDTFLFTLGGGPSGMDKYADIEVWPFQMYIAENANDPDVSASGSIVAVVYSQDGDVKCKASNDDGDTFSETTVATGAGYPCVYVAGSRIYVAYVQDENLYITHSDNLGETWDTPIRINDEDDSVAEEPGTADLGEYGIVWTDTREGTYEIFFEYMKLAAGAPPSAPDINGPDEPKIGQSTEYGFTSTDPDDNDIAEYIINWGDGTTDTVAGAASGVEVKASHTWSTGGVRIIKARAKDSTGLTGPEGQKEVNVPRNRALGNSFFLRFLEQFPILKYLLGL